MSEFAATLQDVFERLGPIRLRKMFGGYGVYYQDAMFGLTADDVLYLKADAGNVSYFEQKGLKQFEYQKNEKIVKMSYYLAPEEIFDDRDEAALWARRSLAAALRAQTPKKTRQSLRNK